MGLHVNKERMKQKLFLLCFFSIITLFAQGQDNCTLRSLVFDASWYYNGIEAALFENGSFVTYHTNDGYNTFVQDVEHSSDYSSNLVYFLNPRESNLQDVTFSIIASIRTNDGSRSVQDVDCSSIFELESDKMSIKDGKLYMPVKITQENKTQTKYNTNHQALIFALKAHRDASEENEEMSVYSDYATIMFSTHEEKPLDISFKGISWWDEEGDYTIDLPTHVFQVTEDKIDNVKDSIIINGDKGHPVAIHKVSTDANGITKCCLSVEDSPEKIYGYTYINIKFLPNTTGISDPVNNVRGDKDSNVYNILGQKVSEVTKGLYIKNGKVYLKR